MSSRTRLARLLSVAGTVLLIVGVIAIVVAVRAQQSPPQPPLSAASPVNVIPTPVRTPTSTPTPTPTSTPTSTHTSTSAPTSAPTSAGGTVPGPATTTGSSTASGPPTSGPVLARSTPISLRIPAINVDSTLNQIGLNSQGEITTPPLVKDSHAYWLTASPTPGQLGPATIIGHVDSAAYGPGVFFKLGDMRQRDKIYITRADGAVATFEVERVAEYAKADFPTQQVYGNIDHAGLRLITCGGTFDSSIHSYESNIVVYAALVSALHP
ncbi:MAG: class F sortase [Actinomycetota bacterium]|nr:class F sortase [Actinomycetota bacterium]